MRAWGSLRLRSRLRRCGIARVGEAVWRARVSVRRERWQEYLDDSKKASASCQRAAILLTRELRAERILESHKLGEEATPPHLRVCRISILCNADSPLFASGAGVGVGGLRF